MFIARETKPPPAAFGGAEMCLRAEGLVGFRSSERRWSNISTRAINISLLRSENRAVEEIACRSVRRQTFRAVSPQSIFSQLLPWVGFGPFVQSQQNAKNVVLSTKYKVQSTKFKE